MAAEVPCGLKTSELRGPTALIQRVGRTASVATGTTRQMLDREGRGRTVPGP